MLVKGAFVSFIAELVYLLLWYAQVIGFIFVGWKYSTMPHVIINLYPNFQEGFAILFQIYLSFRKMIDF